MTTILLPRSTYGMQPSFLQTRKNNLLLTSPQLCSSFDEIMDDLSAFYRMNVTEEPDESGYNWVAPPKVGRQSFWSSPWS